MKYLNLTTLGHHLSSFGWDQVKGPLAALEFPLPLRGRDVKIWEGGEYSKFAKALCVWVKPLEGSSSEYCTFRVQRSTGHGLYLYGRPRAHSGFQTAGRKSENGSGVCCPETQAWSLWTGRQLHTELWIKTPSRLHQGTVTWAHWSLLFRVFRFFSGVKWEATVIGLCEVNWSQLWET